MKNSVVAGEVKLRDSWFYTHTHTEGGRETYLYCNEKRSCREKKKYDLGEKRESYWSHQSH